jgi:hypothetical protein
MQSTRPKDGTLALPLSAGQRSRLASGGSQRDFWGIELIEEQRRDARHRDGSSERYEGAKAVVRCTANNALQYEQGIKTATKLIRY